MEKDKKVTALYCRLSKDDGSNSESLSIRTQKSMLMEYATRNGFGNCQYYVDDGYSGTNSDRPAFQELLDDIREGKVATVITKDQSRLGRNHIETGTYMEIFFPEHGVRYIAINDGYDSNEQSQMDIAPFRNIINEMYAKDTSRKIKSALRTRKKSGKYISSGAPFGYQKDPADHNHLVIDPNTAPVVEYIYSMAEEGLGLHRIAKRLHDEKVLKPCYYKKEMFGRFIDDEKMYDWDSAYISQVLHSPVYAGHIIYEAKPTVSMKSKKRRYIPFEERAIVPNTHEAIIPQDRWENVQRILYSRSSSFMCDKTDYDNIFKGIVRCADCGRTMLVKVEHRRKRNSVLDQTFYCCSTYRKYGAKACDSHNLEARVLHEAVFADIQAHAKAAVSNREALVKKIANQMHLRVSSDRAQHKRDLKQCKARIAEIEDLYAFIVATHTDREHIHNHIIYNSTALDSIRKFRDFLLSGLAVQRLSDLICLEHQLSVIEIKPYRERQKRTLYPPKESNRDRLCGVIDTVLAEKPKDYEDFLQGLEQQGYEVKRGKYTSVKGARQKRFIRFRTLGAGYSEEELKAVISGEAEHHPRQKQKRIVPEQKFQMLVDIQAKLAEGKSMGYARWAKRYNLKEMSKTLIFLQEHKIGSIKEMQERVDAATARYHELGDSIKAAEARMTEIAVLRTHIVNYARTRPVYDAYRKAGYSKRFLEAHREEITLHKAAKAAFDEAGLKKLPKTKDLSIEYAELLKKKKEAYPDYRKAQDEMQELMKAQKNVEMFFAEEKDTAEKEPTR